MVKIRDRILHISDIFQSISGEVAGFPQGSACIFIRLAGCNLQCSFCDAVETQQIREQDRKMTIDYLFKQIEGFKSKLIIITGGEPFTQNHKSLIDLVNILIFWGYSVSIETNGTYRIPAEILSKVTIVMDYKLNFTGRMKPIHFIELNQNDFIKFVINNKIQMALALSIQRTLMSQGCLARFAYSPMITAGLYPEELMAEYYIKSDIILKMLRDSTMTGILNLQIHKIINQQ